MGNKIMVKRTVLLTGAGGAVAPALIRRLQNNGYKVLAADMDKFAVGLFLADKGFIIPAGNSDEFIPVLKNICKKEKVDILITGVDEELIPSLELEKEGVIVLIPRREFVFLCLDKYNLMKNLELHKINVPKTRLVSEGIGDISFPIIIKPRCGRGSRGIGVVNTKVELASFIKTSPYGSEELILQKYIDGAEYTVSVVVWRDGEVQVVVPKKVICKKGITKLAITERNDKIENLCYRVQKKLRADGPFNVQLKLDILTGEPYIFEINPRFSTTISLTIASGIDELIGLSKQALEGIDSYTFDNWKEGIVLVRQMDDIFMSKSKFKKALSVIT